VHDVCCSTGSEWIVDVLSAHEPTADSDTDAPVSPELSLLQQIRDNFAAAATLYAHGSTTRVLRFLQI